MIAYSVATFLLVVFAVPWVLLLLLRPVAGTSIWVPLVWLLPTVWAPTVASLFLMSRTEIRARLGVASGTARWFLMAVVVPVLGIAVAVGVARADGAGAPFTSAPALPVAIVLQLLTGATGEELGWRGFLLPRLGAKFGETSAAWVMGVLWSFWHLPAYFFPGTSHHDLMPMLPSLLFTACFGVFIAFVFSRARGSVIATMAAHLSLNICTALGGVQLSSPIYWWTVVAAFGLLAAILTFARRYDRSAEPAHVGY